jgi:amino acid adenylation domain-containing protein
MGEQTWNYRQLNQRANHLGRTLLALGVQPGDLVGVCLERSAEMIASFLAILKVGGAYVPLDPAYPEERLQFMLEDSGVRVCISQASLAERLRAANLHLLLLDQDAGELAMNQLDNLGPLRSTNALAGETLAYVMYTSGSTGAPKGICIPQGAISRLVLNTDYLQIQPRDRIAQASNASFDAATFEIWGALLNGGCLVFVPQETALSPGGLGQLIREQGIQVMFLTTALFNQIAAFQPQTFQPLRTLLFGGEAVTPGSVRAVLEAGPPQRLLHVYGPTESTTFATWHLVSQVAENAQTIPIGKPITNTLAYILDGRLQPLPVGVAGELYLGGDGLAAGYLNRPELTAKKFITNPYGAGRLYRTGDMARRLADGDIEFIGRIDQQVKLRGFRVELGEIEAVLEACPGVYRAVVLLREDEPGAKRLVAYLTLAPGEQPTPAELRAQLKTRLPDFMLPAAFVILEAFPVSPNGKIDRRALPAPSGERLDAGKEIVAPRDDLEASLCQSWGEILNVHPLGIHDNFFELGGHSLLAVRLLEQIARQYGRRLPLVSLFEAPTVAQLASLMRREEQQAAQIALVPIQAQGVQQPFFFLPNFGGGLFNLKPLANAMGVQRPFYSFQPRGLDGNQPPHNSLPEMAAYYIRAMRAFQPEGPYLIGGFCFGGVVAYEMARQLEAQGQRASLLAIVDGYAPGQAVQGRSFRRLWIFLRNFPYWLHDFLGMGPREMWVNIRRRMLMIGKQLVGKFGKPVEVRPADLVIHQPPDTPDSYQRLMEAHMQAILDYRAGTYRGCVKVLRVQRMPLFSQYDPDLGWGRLAHGGVEIEFVPGGHHNMLEPPYVFDLAAQLNRIIEKAC